MLKLVDGVLELLVEDKPVRNHYHGIKDLLVPVIVQAG